jgi:hypothetical protein
MNLLAALPPILRTSNFHSKDLFYLLP